MFGIRNGVSRTTPLARVPYCMRPYSVSSAVIWGRSATIESDEARWTKPTWTSSGPFSTFWK
jgi:hypothetical protein